MHSSRTEKHRKKTSEKHTEKCFNALCSARCSHFFFLVCRLVFLGRSHFIALSLHTNISLSPLKFHQSHIQKKNELYI